MLQYRTIDQKTLELLKDLMLLPFLQEFFLVGEMALALQIGHRISVDIDMFTLSEFDSKDLMLELAKQFVLSNVTDRENTLTCDVADKNRENEFVKVDFIRYSYPLINPILKIDNIRLLSVADIIPMKLSAIAGRGAKKDFYDIFYLLKNHRLEEMFSLFENKFPRTNIFQVLKSLTYFDDAESEPDPETIEDIEWSIVKERITAEVNGIAGRQY